MRSRMWIVAVIIAALGAEVGAVAADLAPRYKMAKGDKLEYRCVSEGNGTVLALGQTSPLTVSAEFRYVVECTAVGQDGNMTVVHRILDSKIQATRGTEEIPVKVDVPTVTTVITPTGRIISTEVQKAAGEAAPAAGLDLGGILGGGTGGLGQGSQLDVAQFFGTLSGPGFPVEAVHPGSRWQDTLKLTTASGQELDLSYVSTFLDYVALTERKCARLQTTYEAPLDLSLMGGQLFNLTGKTGGSQTAYFDYEAGRMLRSDGTSDTEMKMSVPQFFGGAGNTQSATANVHLTTSVVLETGAGNP